jgi:hypothetical protein
MGSSSFRIANVAPSYFKALVAMVWNSWHERKQMAPNSKDSAIGP